MSSIKRRKLATKMAKQPLDPSLMFTKSWINEAFTESPVEGIDQKSFYMTHQDNLEDYMEDLRKATVILFIGSLLHAFSFVAYIYNIWTNSSYIFWVINENKLSVPQYVAIMFWLWIYAAGVLYILYVAANIWIYKSVHPAIVRPLGTGVLFIVMSLLIIGWWIVIIFTGPSVGYSVAGVFQTICWFIAFLAFGGMRYFPHQISLEFLYDYWGNRVWITSLTAWLTYLASETFFAAAVANGASPEDSADWYILLLIIWLTVSSVIVAIGMPSYGSRPPKVKIVEMADGTVYKHEVPNMGIKWFSFVEYRRDGLYSLLSLFIVLGIALEHPTDTPVRVTGIVCAIVLGIFTAFSWFMSLLYVWRRKTHVSRSPMKLNMFKNGVLDQLVQPPPYEQ